MVSRSGPKRSASPRKRSPAKRMKKTTKKAAAHMYKEMIIASVTALKQRGGSSRQAISKYITGHYKVGDNFNVHLRMAIKRALASGMLIQAFNHSGTFRISAAARKPAKPKKAVKKTKKAKKPKKKVAPKKAKKSASKKKAASKSKRPVKKAKKPTKKATAREEGQ